MCVCVCMHACAYMHVCVYKHACIRICVYVCVQIRVRVHVCVHVYVYVCAGAWEQQLQVWNLPWVTYYQKFMLIKVLHSPGIL